MCVHAFGCDGESIVIHVLALRLKQRMTWKVLSELFHGSPIPHQPILSSSILTCEMPLQRRGPVIRERWNSDRLGVE